ncbi:MAG: putative zinc protease [bacterium]|nr:putative zinc protease [bacterium]
MSTTLTSPESRFAFIQDIQDHTLPNGLRVLLLPRPQVPSVAIGCWLRAGGILDPEPLMGLAHLTARGIGDGTPARSKEALDEAIDFVGGSYHFSAGSEGSSGGMQFLSEHLPLALEILGDTLQHSQFPEEEVARGKKQVEGGIRSELERPGDLCERVFVEQVAAGSPYGWHVEGTLESVPLLSREAVAAFHTRHYGARDAIIALAGAFDPAATLGLIESHFGSWEGPQVEPPAPTLPPAMTESRQVLVHRPIQQANLRLGWMSIPRGHADYYPFLMLNYIYGASSLSSRIGVEVRDNQGLAYQVASRYSPFEHVGVFSVVLQTSNSTAQQALAGVRGEMTKLQEEQVTDLELDDARSFFRDRFPLTIETNGAMAGQLLSIARYGLPLTHFRDHIEAITSVTKDDIQRAAQTYFHPERSALAVVADLEAAGFGPAV